MRLRRPPHPNQAPVRSPPTTRADREQPVRRPASLLRSRIGSDRFGLPFAWGFRQVGRYGRQPRQPGDPYIAVDH